MSSLPPLQAAIVDLDGTLIDTLGDFVVALNRCLQDLDLPGIDRQFVANTVGKGSEHLLRSTLAHVGADPALYAAAWARYQAHYQAINGQHAQVYPGVEQGLSWLHSQGLRLACLTNKPTAFAQPLLQRMGLAGYFERIYGGDAFERCKPDPLPLWRTCEALGSEPSRSLMIGDSSNDAEAARAAGCPLVLVTYGYNHGQDVRALPAWAHLDRLDQLAHRLRQGLGV
jgi:phosphoglycolate phosphatase